MSGLTSLQAIINHEMLNALGKFLPSVKEDGLVLPKLVQAFTVYNASERLKHKEHH